MKQKKSIFASMIGNALEYYDVTLYGFFSFIIAPLFFPSSSKLVSFILALCAFSLGFLMRPVGAIVFGHIGDKYGRKTALVWAIALVTLPTICIGILPTYETLGIIAPITIVICRLFQGLCTGGEYMGASVYIFEQVPQKQQGFFCSILPASSLTGALVGTILGSLFTQPFIPSWGWRIPFILGGVFGIFGFYLRSKYFKESGHFIENKNSKKLLAMPILEVLKSNSSSFLCTICIGSSTIVAFYLVTIYFGHIAKTFLGFSNSNIFYHSTFIMISLIITFPIMGWIADKIGLEKLMKFACLGMIIFSYPVFYYLLSSPSLEKLIFADIFFILLSAAYVAPSSPVVAKLFPTVSRYSGAAIGIALGEAAFGGTTPLIAMQLTKLGGHIAPAFYLIFIGALAFIGIFFAKKKSDPFASKTVSNLVVEHA